MALVTSELWRELFATGIADREYKFEINGVAYGRDEELSHSAATGLFDKFGIGNAVCGSLQLSVYAEDIPKGAEIRRYVRLYVEDQVSEWLPAGVYWPNRRPHEDGVWDIEAYDAMRKAEVEWVPDQTLEFPMSMSDAAAEIARLMGVELDPRTQLNPAYTIDYPATGTTQRQVLQWIAAAHGGNFIVTAEGKLRLVLVARIGEAEEEVLGTEDGAALDFGGFCLATRAAGSEDDRPLHQIGQDLVSAHNNGLTRPVSRVTLLLDDNNVVTAGDDTGLELSAECPYAVQAMADEILARLAGYQFQMFDASEVNIDPAAELGDLVEADGITSVLAQIDDDGSGYPDIAAPGEAEMEDEYPAEGPMTREFNRKLAENYAALEKSNGEIRAYVENEVKGALAEVDVKLDAIRLEVSQEAGADGRVYARLTLTVGPNKYSGLITMEGNLQVSGQLSADALYAALGDIADLTVDRVSTSRRIVLYLKKDMSDDNYVRIRDQYIELVTGSTDGTTEQAVNPSGVPIYWEDDPEGATLGTDGYPYRDGQRIYTTTKQTNWPVTVYRYGEAVKRSSGFEKIDGIYTPVDLFGAGDEVGNQRARLVKKETGLELLYTTIRGKEVGMTAGDDGYLDLYGLRKTVGLDFSGWDSGTFTETVEGVDEPYSYRVDFDGEGRPVKISDDTGFELAVTW